MIIGWFKNITDFFFEADDFAAEERSGGSFDWQEENDLEAEELQGSLEHQISLV